MLVLTRKQDEAVIIGNDIVVQVLESRGGQIRLGITAPRDISVHRQEIYERIHGRSPLIEYGQNVEEEVS
jgi:carbon storage regulator